LHGGKQNEESVFCFLGHGAGVFTGCPTDDDGSGSSTNPGTTQDLNGTTWTAAITASGITTTYTLVFQQTTYTWTYVISGGSQTVNSGTYTVSGNSVNITRTNPDTLEMVGTLNGAALTLSGIVYTKQES
jgi:hypothetical protein